MSTRTRHPLAAEYLGRLERAAARVPGSRRAELVAEIDAHLSDAIAPGASDAEALTVLDRLGTPEEIVEAESPRPVASEEARGVREWAAIFLLLFGGLFAGLGWVAGVILLWASRAWTTRDKWIGTLVVPGGLATSLVVFAIAGVTATGETCVSTSGGAEHCSGGTGTGGQVVFIAVLAILLLAPIASAVYLARRAGRAAATE